MSKPSPNNPVPTPIPLTEIASQAQSATESLREIEASLSTDRITTSIEKRLPHLREEIRLRAVESDKLLTASLPVESLQRMGVVFQIFRDELSTWNHDLTRRAKTLGDQIVHLDQLSNIWQSTLQLPELSQSAPEILTRVRDLIDSFGRTRQAVESRRAKVLTMESRVLASAALVQTASSAIDEAQANAVKSLFVQDSPPIWWSLAIRNWREEGLGSLFLQASVSVARAYIRSRRTIFLLHAIIILFLLLTVHWLRRGVHKWTAEEPILRRAAPVFDLPISTPIALSFLITTPAYSLAPGLLQATLGGAVLIPTALILRRLIDRKLFPILNALLVFYFVDQLRLITVALPALARFTFGAEMLGATLFLIWLIRSEHMPTVDNNATKWSAGVIRGATQFGLLVFPAALLANVFGYVNLANLLGNGSLRSAYVAVALYAALRIVEGLIIIVLQVRPLASMRVVRLHRPTLQRRIFAVAGFLAFAFWLSLALNFFALRTPLITSAEAVLRANLIIGSLNVSLGQVLAFIVTVWASFLVSRFLRFLLEEDIYHHWRLRGIPQAISTMIHYAVLLLGFFVALATLGVDLTKVTILAGAFTVGVGFGLQTVINNFVCGLILLFERPIKVGDVIQVDADVGEVRRIGIRACIIRTMDGAEIIVPNGTLISNKVANWTFSDRYRAVEVSVSVARGVAPQRVVEVLKSVAANQPSVAKEPPPQAYAVSFAPGAVSFQLRAWTDRYEDWIQVRSDLATAVDDALTRENITIA